MPDQNIVRAPEHVVQTESLLLGAVRQLLLERHPQLQPRHVDFLCAPWVHFFTHSALHRLESSGGPPAGGHQARRPASTDQQRAVPGDTLAFMEFFRTPAYRAYLDQTLAGAAAAPACRTGIHVLDEKLPAYARTVAFMSCLPRNFRYRLQLYSLGRIRFLENKPRSQDIETDWSVRAELSRRVQAALAGTLTEAAAWLGARVQELFPKSLLEHLAANLQQKQLRPARRTLFSADGWQIIDDWKIYALVQKTRHGTRWIGMPNAISHGSLAVFWQREFETSHMDSYLTWGWSREGAPHVHPFYSPHFAGQQQAAPARTDKPGGILISSAARPQHLLEYPYTPDRFERYLRTQLDLAVRAQQATGERVTIRTRPRDLGWDLKEMVRALGNDRVSLEFQAGKFAERLQQSWLHICDNCSTTIVESLWANHPTLILIDGGYFQLHPAARDEYDALEKAGIFHRSAASLLLQLESIQADVGGWWTQPSTQQAIRQFLARQGNEHSSLPEWRRALLDRPVQQSTIR